MTAQEATVLAALCTMAGTILGAVLTLIGVHHTAKIARKNTAHTALVSSVTAERATWRRDLRDAIGGLASEVLLYAEHPTTKRMASIEKHRVAIRLRLNPKRTKRHGKDAAILDGLIELRSALKAGRFNHASMLVEGIERAAQLIFKGEWEKSKREAQAGSLDQDKHPDEDVPILGSPLLCCDLRPVFTTISPRIPRAD